MATCCTVSSLPMTPTLPVAVLHERTYPNSHSYRVTAQDGGQYIMKVFPPAMAQMLYYREVFANQMGIRLGFSMAHWNVLHLDDQTSKEYLNRSQNVGSQENVSAGIYFGTRVLEGPGQFRHYLSGPLTRMNPETARQLGCIRILDFWLAHGGARRYGAIVDGRRPVHVYFFGNSQILSPENSECMEKRAALAYEAACRTAGSPKVIDDIISVICNLRENDLRQAIRAVPAIWRNSHIEAKTVRMLEFRRDWMRAKWRPGFLSKVHGQFLVVQDLCETPLRNHAGYQVKTT